MRQSSNSRKRNSKSKNEKRIQKKKKIKELNQLFLKLSSLKIICIIDDIFHFTSLSHKSISILKWFSYFLFYYGKLEGNQSNTIVVIDRLIESGSTQQKGFEVYSLCRSICVGPEQTQFIRQDRNSFGSPQLGHRDTPTGRVNFKISLSLFRLEDNVESFVYSF